jgi:glycosyltransferase involved in cell wall biosynthesis
VTVVNQAQRIMHIISGDLWAGAEAQAYTLLKHLPPSLNLHVVVMNQGELAERLKQLNMVVSVLPETQLSSGTIVRRLVQLIWEFKPDVIHTHRQKENILGNLANFIAFPFSSRRPKSIRTTHGAPESIPNGKQKIQLWLDSWIGIHLQQAIIAVSSDLAQKLTSIFPAEKIYIIHNGVDCTELRANITEADFKKAAPNIKHIGIIGRLEPVKRIDIFLEMAALLLKDQAHVNSLQFHIIGDGSLRLAMEQHAKVLGLDSHVRFHGYRSDIPACIFSLDIIVMCSDHEGTPMTALEALALGKPLVAHDVGGLHELLMAQPDLLVFDHAPISYARAVNKFLTINLSKPALDERYTAESNARNMLSIYNDVVNTNE